MKRPWQVWLVFAACAGVALGAMAWLTKEAVHADVQRSQARAVAELEQKVSLVLWRMDTKLAPWIAEELARPAIQYRSFYEVNEQYDGQMVLRQIPSPLLLNKGPHVLLNFELSADGTSRSPQVPPEEFQQQALQNNFTQPMLAENRALLDELAEKLDPKQLLARLPEEELPGWQEQTSAMVQRETKPDDLEHIQKPSTFFSANTTFPNYVPGPEQADDGPGTTPEPIKKTAPANAAASLQQRGERFQSIAQQELRKLRSQMGNYSQVAAGGPTVVSEGLIRPVWVGQDLLLARRVVRSDQTVVQGSWLDWPGLRDELLTEAKGLLPNASLAPVYDVSKAPPSRMLAGLPVELNPGEKRLVLSISDAMRWTLWGGWAALLLAVAAVAVLLLGVVALSERRAVFVSSVTHELRTPLTTFRMYAEMLLRGMVPDAERRQEYLQTLHREAGRLTHLVENVLAYARLERGRKPAVADRLTPATLFERVGPRLSHRAQEAGMECVMEMGDSAAQIELATDQGVVEQILFNLVDNAAKYARAAADRRIHVTARGNGPWVELSVRDHGPGIQARRSWRLRPFGKSAQESAETAPGVGLGLALCRRLARQLGGRLEIAGAPDGGAVGSLMLPV